MTASEVSPRWRLSHWQWVLGGLWALVIVALEVFVVITYFATQRSSLAFGAELDVQTDLVNIQRHAFLLRTETGKLLNNPALPLTEIDKQRAVMSAQLNILRGQAVGKPEVLDSVQKTEAALQAYDALMAPMRESPSAALALSLRPQVENLFGSLDLEVLKPTYDRAETEFYERVSQSLRAQQQGQLLLISMGVLFFLSSAVLLVSLLRSSRAVFNVQQAQVVTLEQRVADRTQALADRTKALAASAEVSRRLSTILNRQELVTEVVEQVNKAFGYYHTQIYFYDDAKENLVMAGGTGEAGALMLAQFHKVARGRGLVGRAAESNAPVLVTDTAQNEEWLPNRLLPDTQAEIALPISTGDEVWGVLDVQQNGVNGLQQEDVDALQAIANQVAVALQNIQSTETVVKRATELQTVAKISTVAATIPDIQEMLESVVHLTQRGFGLYHAHVFTYESNQQLLQIMACGYKEGDEHEGTHGTAAIPLNQEQSLVARAARSRLAVIVNDVRSDPGWLPNPLLPDTQSEMAVPMIVGEQLLGVLDVQAERINAFSQEDASIQTTLASQVATALQNARSFAQSKKQAERETAVNLITQKIQNTATVEEALQMAARELGHALGMKQTVVSLDPEALTGEPKSN